MLQEDRVETEIDEIATSCNRLNDLTPQETAISKPESIPGEEVEISEANALNSNVRASRDK